MSSLESVPLWISAPDPAAPVASTLQALRPPTVATLAEARAPMRVGIFSLRQIVGSAVSRAEAEAIRRALAALGLLERDQGDRGQSPDGPRDGSVTASTPQPTP